MRPLAGYDEPMSMLMENRVQMKSFLMSQRSPSGDFQIEIKSGRTGQFIFILSPTKETDENLDDWVARNATDILKSFRATAPSPVSEQKTTWVVKKGEFFQKILLKWDGQKFESTGPSIRFNQKAFETAFE